MAWPKGIKTKQLNSLERQRIRTLSRDAQLSRHEIERITGYTEMQVKGPLRATSQTPIPRTGRPLSISYDQEFSS